MCFKICYCLTSYHGMACVLFHWSLLYNLFSEKKTFALIVMLPHWFHASKKFFIDLYMFGNNCTGNTVQPMIPATTIFKIMISGPVEWFIRSCHIISRESETIWEESKIESITYLCRLMFCQKRWPQTHKCAPEASWTSTRRWWLQWLLVFPSRWHHGRSISL